MVTTIADIDYDTMSDTTFRLTYTVSDTLISSTGNLTLKIVNVNEPPQFQKKYYELSPTENIVRVCL